MKNKIQLSAFIAKVKSRFHFGAEENTRQLQKKVALSALVFLVVAAISVSALSHERNVQQSAKEAAQDPSAKIVLYYSNSCPHCKNVEEYIADNGIESKVNFAQKEVGKNAANGNEMIRKSKLCNLPEESMGSIPLLWDGENGNKCLVGDKDIIEYFRIKANLQ